MHVTYPVSLTPLPLLLEVLTAIVHSMEKTFG